MDERLHYERTGYAPNPSGPPEMHSMPQGEYVAYKMHEDLQREMHARCLSKVDGVRHDDPQKSQEMRLDPPPQPPPPPRSPKRDFETFKRLFLMSAVTGMGLTVGGLVVCFGVSGVARLFAADSETVPKRGRELTRY